MYAPHPQMPFCHLGSLDRLLKANKPIKSKVMEDIYKETAKAAYFGKPFSVDFKKRNLTVEKKKIIVGGTYEGELGVPTMPLEEVLDKAEELYAKYKRSIPNKLSSHSKPHFRALKLDELNENDLIESPWREHARARLEVFLLCCLINGSLDLDKLFEGKWFWQSEKEPMFVLRRSMFVTEPRKGKTV